jgi:four helix bundle protein
LFAIRIVKLSNHLTATKKECVLSKQLLRSGTSIGANIAEAEQAQSKADFISKMNIALKEAVETNYWLRLLHATDYLSETEFTSIHSDCRELEKC